MPAYVYHVFFQAFDRIFLLRQKNVIFPSVKEHSLSSFTKPFLDTKYIGKVVLKVHWPSIIGFDDPWTRS